MLRTRFYWLALVLCVNAAPAAAQSFDPFDGHSTAFRASPERYFSSPAKELEQRKRLLDKTAVFTKNEPWTPAMLDDQLALYEKLLVSLNRHYAYFQLLGYRDKRDTAARSAKDQVDQLIDSLDRYTAGQLRRPLFSVQADNKAYRYHYLLQKTRSDAEHELNPVPAAIAARLSDPLIQRLTDRYDNLMDDIRAPDLLLPDGQKLNPVTNRNKVLQYPDAAVRARGMKAYYNAYSAHAELLAGTLIDITASKNELAQLRGFKSSPEATYARRLQLPEDSVRVMLRQMMGLAAVLKNYQRVQATQVKLINGLDTVHSWDMSLPSGYSFQQLPFGQVKALTLRAFLPLGKPYQHLFAWLLDPANGALDIAAGPDRVNENTSVGYPGVPVTLYMKSYGGSLGEVLRLSHEGGHAIHMRLMSEAGIVPSYAAGPSFLFEAYAMLNELLVLDELQQQATTAKAKAFYTQAFLDKLSLEIFTAAEEGSFEQGLYDGVAAGRMHDRKDVDSLYAGIMGRYDLFFQAEPERRSEWINKRLVFDDPLYNVNYLYAMLLTCRLYEQAHRDPTDFGRRYAALLRNGFDASADELIRKFMGFGLDNQALLRSALELMQQRTKELASLYKELNLEKD
ncbi:oligopeptidase F [Mucilaginibacter gracilis]|uniref:Oligopeptidase F n=1 Tax=Mucilaginibacter gracilis TaxID=423350 RepID=A0A495J305_9SPHI|nr:M3 family metallopeptidase [Mucilaginibacter gracilis]RKR83366.1 oligopeptidase F [Mucilaginibacter gracilis]